MRVIAITLVCLGLLGGSMVGAGAQSLYGPGGLFLYPTADVSPKGQVTIGALVLPQRVPPDLAPPGGHTSPTWGSVSLDYGVTPDIEIAATTLMITDFEPSWGGSFKYRFLHEDRRHPTAAMGFTFLGLGGNDTQTGFLAVRKQLNSNDRHRIVGHVGVEYIHILASLDYNQFLPYGGFEWGLTPHWTVIAEARPRGHGDIKVSTALSVAYRYGKNNRLVLTWANTGQSSQPRIGFGVGYTIGTRR